MRVISSGADTLAEPMPGHRAHDILTDESLDDWPDFDVLGDEESEPDPDDEPD